MGYEILNHRHLIDIKRRLMEKDNGSLDRSMNHLERLADIISQQKRVIRIYQVVVSLLMISSLVLIIAFI